MISKSKFLENEIPYKMLEDLGISRKNVLDMPKDLIEPLVNGRITPLVMTRYKAENGKVVEMPMKLQLFREENGEVNLMTYQVHKSMEKGHFRLTEQEQEKLKDGEALKREVREDGVRKQKFIQLDKETMPSLQGIRPLSRFWTSCVKWRKSMTLNSVRTRSRLPWKGNPWNSP